MPKTRILVVDDEEDVRDLCRINLEYDGFEVVEAVDGDQAMTQVENLFPDLILLDIMMPKLDGLSVLERLKSNPSTASIPVIMLSAKTDEASQLRGWELGVANYLTKPFSPYALTKFIRRTLEDDRDTETLRRRNTTQGLRKLQEIRGAVPPSHVETDEEDRGA